MPSTINADNGAISGSAGVKTTADSSGVLDLQTNGTTRLTIDTSGNLGVGVTPSAWALSGSGALQVKNAGFAGYLNNAYVAANQYFTSAGGSNYIANGFASMYIQQSGQHQFFSAPSGTAGNAISFTQAMTLDASGNLGVGTTSPTVALDVYRTAYPEIRTRSASYTNTFGIDTVGGFGVLGSVTNNAFVFTTNNTERARITSGGDLLVGTTTGTGKIDVVQTGSASALRLTSSSASDSYGLIQAATRAVASATNILIIGQSGDGTNITANNFFVRTNGNVTNTNGSYGTISDAKMKTDIVDAGSQWDDLKAVRFRKFKMKNDPQQIMQLGVVAQELEQTSPNLIEEHKDIDAEGNDLGTTIKSVKTSVLMMKAAVALQEAMTRIESLEAEVAALKAR